MKNRQKHPISHVTTPVALAKQYPVALAAIYRKIERAERGGRDTVSIPRAGTYLVCRNSTNRIRLVCLGGKQDVLPPAEPQQSIEEEIKKRLITCLNQIKPYMCPACRKNIIKGIRNVTKE